MQQLTHLHQNKIIELSNVTMQYDNHVVLHNVNFTINEGDFVAITGPNGGGKTTLLKIILQLIKPTFGKVTFWQNQRIDKNLKVGYLPQKNMIDNKFPISVEEVITSGLLGSQPLFHRNTLAEKEKVANVMSMMGVEALKKESIGNLSGGQLQRTLLGRAIISDPKILILDEPLSYIDKHFEQQMYSIIADIAKSTTMILVSHEMTTIAQMANRHVIVDREVHSCHAEHHYIKSDCD